MSKDGIVLLRQDHDAVEQLFKRFEGAGDTAYKTKRSLVDKMIKELSVHAAIEEQILYPAARETLTEDDPVLEALEEHHLVKWTLNELEAMGPEDERFNAKVTVLIDLVRHHVEEEEGELFPALREAMGRARLQKIGEALAQAKKVAPTRPHPRLPDTPPGNIVAGAAAAGTDRVLDLAKGAVRTVRKKVPGRR